MIDPFGATPSLQAVSADKLQNGYSSIEDTPVVPETERLQPRSVSAGVSRTPQVIIGSGGLPQVLSGPHKTLGNGFFVSNADTNVVENTDPANLIFNSNQNVFKIVSSGTLRTGPLAVPAAAAGTFESEIAIASASHNLGYVPAILAYAVFGDGGASSQYIPLPWTTFSGGGGGTTAIWNRLSVDVTSTTVRVLYNTMTFGTFSTDDEGYTVKYFLLQETAN